MADAAHLVGCQAKILPRVFLRDIGDTKGLVKVFQLGFAHWELTSFLVPHDIWCWSKEREGNKSSCKTTFLIQILHLRPSKPKEKELWATLLPTTAPPLGPEHHQMVRSGIFVLPCAREVLPKSHPMPRTLLLVYVLQTSSPALTTVC